MSSSGPDQNEDDGVTSKEGHRKIGEYAQFCTECGTEISKNQNFCHNCGEDIRGSGKTDTTVAETAESKDTRTTSGPKEKTDVLRAVGSGLMGFLSGIVLGLSFFRTGLSGIIFILVVIGGGAFLYTTTDNARESVGTGFYMLAISTILYPIISIIVSFSGQSQSGFEIIGGIIALVLIGFVALLLAFVFAGVGYLINRSADPSKN